MLYIPVSCIYHLRDAAELQALKESVADIQSTLSGDNLKVFQVITDYRVEVAPSR